MIKKRPIRPDRIRQIPASFSWVDHRLVRDNCIGRCGHSALALYLFLLTVGDVEGLSYYSDSSLCRYLQMDLVGLKAARQELVHAELIAYQKPLYQGLSLELPAGPSSGSQKRVSEPASLADILRRAIGGENR